MQLVSNAHAHITLTLLIYYSTFLFFYFRYIMVEMENHTLEDINKVDGMEKESEEWEDGSREIAYWVDGKKEGAAKYYDENGNEEDRFYKNGKLVEQ